MQYLQTKENNTNLINLCEKFWQKKKNERTIGDQLEKTSTNRIWELDRLLQASPTDQNGSQLLKLRNLLQWWETCLLKQRTRRRADVDPF